jgi:Uma2 family endonuclease
VISEAGFRFEEFNDHDLRDVADKLLETTWVEYMDEGVLLVTKPPGIEHRRIVRSITECVRRSYYTGQIAVDWAVNENFRWEFADGSRRFFIPDIVLIHPEAGTLEQERAAIVLVVEVTWPPSRDTVFNDRTVKPLEYAKGGVPEPLGFTIPTAAWPRSASLNPADPRVRRSVQSANAAA